MLWLFGQIWLWLLVAFVLGALAGALLTWPARRSRTADSRSAEAAEAPIATSGTATATPATTAPTTSGTATFGAVTPRAAAPGASAGAHTSRSTAPSQAAAAATQQPHHPTGVGHNRGPRREPRTPDVEQTRSAHADDAENHIIGTLDETTGAGRTSGTLPPRRAWHTRNEWPDEADEWATEHDIPRSGG